MLSQFMKYREHQHSNMGRSRQGATQFRRKLRCASFELLLARRAIVDGQHGGLIDFLKG